MNEISKFIGKIEALHKTGRATEHSYRPAFIDLIDGLENDITALNEPKRIECGAPDFIIQRGNIVVGHLEAKDIDVDIRNLKGSNKKQQERYLDALPNLIYSNGLDWDFYRDGKLLESVTIGSLDPRIKSDASQFSKLKSLLEDFISQTPISITSPQELAVRMAGKAKLIKPVFFNALDADLKSGDDTELVLQYETFRDNLIHNIEPESFADIYAETICYGMFAARLHDNTLDTFSRHEALDKLPKTNPFLKNLFSYIAGSGLDERIVWIIDDLAEIFRATDVAAIMAGFGKFTGRQDPFLHFYETFLAAYNPGKRKSRGVWYTPEPVVNFIVRAVDEVLQTEFGLKEGLSDTSKIKIPWDTGQRKLTKAGRPTADGKNFITQKDVHRVQILDPATGTGTFLAEVIKQIAQKVKGVAPGMWSGYVEKELIPRIHGFEIMMASYAMCHMKLDMMLTELGYKPSSHPPRQSVYLTNSLEEGDPPNYSLPFANWLASEVKLANTIKRDMPIMCVIGNPPYLGEGGVSEGWIGSLMDDYKKEPGGKEKLKERNPKWLNDLYVKFMRISSHLIEKNGEGVLGFITNHGYLDNPTFRGMRWHLLHTFDKIWILDLHGSSKKKEKAPDGSPDMNVFDIMQGVSIIIGVKTKHSGSGLAEVMRGDLWGSRAEKYEALRNYNLKDDLFKKIELRPPQYPFAPLDWADFESYQSGFPINIFMPVNGNGIVTKRDKLNIHYTPDGVKQVIEDFLKLSESEVRNKYKLPKDVRDWRYEWARKDIESVADNIPVQEIGYRLFDRRFIFYSGKARGLIGWPVADIMVHYICGKNIGLLTTKAHRDTDFAHVFITDRPTEAIHFSATSGSNAMNFPLYLYPKDKLAKPQVNFEPKLYARLQKLAAHSDHGIPNETVVFDYIYGVLHCPIYRKVYAEFLKTDFPRIPWPASPDEFWHVSAKGGELRRLHLMEPSAISETSYRFMGEGNNEVDTIGKASFRDGKVFINKTQYFANVPETAWSFRIGGYQPAQKWLKDRQGRPLSFEDIKHYQRIIKVLIETDRIMADISMSLGIIEETVSGH
ncbi:type ISP restriction/modification enzyme [Enterobacter quasiroggenkampii]|uniref:type ISP restriction/modification enzyme n=1 Tax=Enterobacter quasiroggenkampii TaxID=2497436 RepID=UPI00064E7E35|nr:type ISP restriction/modification enzyme [Enterobacter quasiroggenkampii]KML20626.1 DNA methyltransferase [Leclercia adecarboxylata]KMN65867.1 DNA methyltransferase [Leclercia sp. LK8]MCM7530554.1 DNA methyltransferase [Enterobacter quasiroggenkampii]